jgi:hypothetical protein
MLGRCGIVGFWPDPMKILLLKCFERRFLIEPPILTRPKMIKFALPHDWIYASLNIFAGSFEELDSVGF